MKLERAQELFTTFVAVLIGMFAAYYFGTLSGAGRFGMVSALFAASAFVAVLLAMREQVWILILLAIPFVAKVTEIKGQPAIRDLAVLAVFSGVFALRAFKVIRRKPSYRALDFWVIVVLLYLLTVFIRNPAGGEAIGSTRVGGRPYLDVFTGALGFWVLARVAMPARFAQRTFLAIAGINVFAGLLGSLQIWFPVLSPAISPLLGGGGDGGDNSGEDDEGRKTYLAAIGLPLSSGLIAGLDPLSLLNPLRIIRFLLFATSIVCLLFSGFRSNLFNLFSFFCIATYIRGDVMKVVRLSFAGAMVLFLIILMQGTVINLPASMQRTLSFLPGRWNTDVVMEAQSSTQWRIDMWERMLKTDRYIENKWLGDGFGMTAMQLQQAQSTASMDYEQIKETFLIAGLVHSGPISTIRYVGYVGLFFFLCLMATMSWEAWKLCLLARGTPYLSVTLLLCVPLIFHPIGFIFIFGSYDADLPSSLIACGVLKMLRTSLEEYYAEKAVEAPPSYIPLEEAGLHPVPAHLHF